ncbi:hypothetical protein OR573_11345 [Halomonas sp. CH40]
MSSYLLNDVCEFSELDRYHHCYNSFNPEANSRLNPSSSPEYVVFRTFLGGICFLKSGEDSIIFDKNYYLIEPQNQFLDSTYLWAEVGNILAPLMLDEQKFLNSFRGRYLENKKFYESFLLEISYSIAASKNERYVESFLHIYRGLEHMSYALPLMYLKRSDGYKKTYEAFKSFFGDDNSQSEMGFGKKFIRSIMDSNIYSANVKMDFSEHPEQHYNALKKIFKSDSDFNFNDDLKQVETIFGRVFDLVVKVRNMYFHHLYSKNYSLDGREIVLPNKFFEVFVDIGMCFLANFYFIIFSSKYE